MNPPLTQEQILKNQLAEARAEVAIQSQMIEGARKAAARIMCQNTEMRSALDRIRIRTVAEHQLRDQFEFVQLIAEEAVQACCKIEKVSEFYP